jgi:ABC-2 type transport system ATP-binding protein
MIKIEKFTKQYGNFTAVSDLSMHVPKGSIFGFIGPNGAGKTTTLRFLATLLAPSIGWAKIAGIDVIRHPYRVRKIMGYMPDSFGVYEGMRVIEYLDFFAAAYYIPSFKRKKLIEEVLSLLDLTEKSDTFVEGLSRGMKQRLCLAKVLIHDPELLILDEPASGLDPRARIEMLELLKTLRDMGKTILISSHILAELSNVCTHVGIIERGKLLAEGPINEVRRMIQQHRSLRIRVIENGERLESLLLEDTRVDKVQPVGGEVECEFLGSDEDLAELHTKLVSSGLKVLEFTEVKVNLEEVFMRVTTGQVQ